MVHRQLARYDRIRPRGPTFVDAFVIPMAFRTWSSITLTWFAALALTACDAGSPPATGRDRTLVDQSSAFPEASPQDIDLSGDKLDRFNNQLESWVEGGDLVGAEVLIVKRGQAAFRRTYGWHDREERVPLEPNAIFSVQSMAKPYVATAALILVDEGRLSLDDPVRRYIPGFPDVSTRVHHLLSHTSGFDCCESVSPAAPEWFGSLREWVDTLVTDERTAPWGSFAYTDYNFNFLGLVVEEITGAPVEAFIEERILQPLGMRETFTTYAPDSAWVDRIPRFYQWIGAAGAYRPSGVSTLHYGTWSPGAGNPWPFFPGSSGIFTTAVDHAVFLSMWMNGGVWNGVRILSEKTVHEALQVHGARGPGYGYGYGWEIREEPRVATLPHDFRHSGIDGTIGVAFPGEDMIVVAMSQARKRGDSVAASILDALASLEIFSGPGAYGPNLVSTSSQAVSEQDLTNGELSEYPGVFIAYAPGTRTVERFGIVREEEGRLRLTLGEPGRSIVQQRHLVPLGGHRFAVGRYRNGQLEAVAPQGEVRFRLGDGRATAMRVHGPSGFTATRADSATLQAAIEWAARRRSVDEVVLETLEADGRSAARELSRRLHAVRPDSVRFSPLLLNSLGYRMLQEERVDDAIAVFEMNVETYPEVPNAHDALGEAYRQAGRWEAALLSFELAMELAREQGHSGLKTFVRRMEQVRREFTGG